MTLTQNKKIFQVVIFTAILLVAVILISILFSLSSSKDKKEEKPLAPNIIVPPSATTLPKSIENIKKEITSSPIENNNGDLLLVKTNDYTIEYIPAPDVFFVNISNNPQESKKQAQEWFKSKGLNQGDLCSLPVRFVLTNFDVRAQDPNFSSLPDGCEGKPIVR